MPTVIEAPRLAIAYIVAASVLSCATTGGTGGGASESHPLVGVHAPAFERPGVVGAGALSTDAARGKVVIVDFWATYCEPCQKEFPRLQELADKHRGTVLVYALSEDDGKEGISAFAKKTGVRFPIGWDEGNAIGHRYKIEKMPTSYVIDRRGIIRYVHGGYVSGEETAIAREVEELLH
jgi:cytochrome c biogenesis protein CcmG, thiol:disulfide interchange protein DsbE